MTTTRTRTRTTYVPDDNWVDVHVCATKQPYLKIMIIGWWWGPLQPYFLPAAANTNGNGMFQIEILITTAAVDSFALPHKRIDL